MSQRVQDKVNHWGEKTKNEVYGQGLEFRNRLKAKFKWDIEDDINILLEEDPGRHPELAANFPGVEMEDDLLDPITALEPDVAVDANLAAAVAAANSGISHTPGVNDDNVVQPVGPQNNNQDQHNPVTDDEDSNSDDEPDHADDAPDHDETDPNNPPLVETIDLANETNEADEPANDTKEAEPDNARPPSGRPKQKKVAWKVYVPEDGTTGYININTAEETKAMTEEERNVHIFHLVMTQFALKTGLKQFKKRGELAVTNELTQLHMMETFIPQDATKLTRQQRREALGSLMFLKEKRNGEIKTRVCRREEATHNN
jgi:hypothetical protein